MQQQGVKLFGNWWLLGDGSTTNRGFRATQFLTHLGAALHAGLPPNVSGTEGDLPADACLKISIHRNPYAKSSHSHRFDSDSPVLVLHVFYQFVNGY